MHAVSWYSNYVPLNFLAHAVVQVSHMFKLIVRSQGKMCQIQRKNDIHKFIYVMESINKLVIGLYFFPTLVCISILYLFFSRRSSSQIGINCK